MQTRILRLSALILAALWMLASTRNAAAQDLWMMAGTFNNWQTNDADWTMGQLNSSRSDIFFIDHFFEAGIYEFKFVRNGAWDNGHLGAADDPRSLTEPGENLVLRVKHPAVYRILLDTRRLTWSQRVASIDQPVLDLRVFGVPQALLPFTISYASSLVTQGLTSANLVIDTSKADVLQMPTNPTDHEFLFRPNKPGPMSISIRLTDHLKVTEQTLDFDVGPHTELRFLRRDSLDTPEQVFFEPQGNGILRAFLAFDQDTTLSTIQVEIGNHVAARASNLSLPAGTYVVDLSDYEVVDRENEGLPSFIQPGHWRRFLFAPQRDRSVPDTVHLIADFNNWATPTENDAIELIHQWDGVFTRIINIPEGAHRYQFLLDGRFHDYDRRNDRMERDESGNIYSITMAGPTPDDFPMPKPNQINLDAVRHQPTLARDFRPISSQLGLVDLSLSTLPDDVESVTLVAPVGPVDWTDAVRAESQTLRIPMTRTRDAAGFDRWSSRIMFHGPQARYRFVLGDGTSTRETESFSAPIEPSFDTPDWAKGVVWYQIFPERFRNGTPSNDPHGPGVTLTPWTNDWYSISPEEERAWRTRTGLARDAPWPPRKGGPLYHVVWDRRYGGDLQGVLDKLDHLVELGVGAIYLNPIFEAESLHKYDTTDYRHIDDNLATPASAGPAPERWQPIESETEDPATWTWTPADRFFVDTFLPACKARGIKVILDGVFNHTGRAFWAFADIEELGVNSRYRDWYYTSFDKQGKLKHWESWYDTGSLPKFRQTTSGDLVPPVKEHIFNITRRWMDPNGDGDPSDGIDGWRLDVALDVGLPFWRDWRKLVKGINPDAMIIAEIWNDADAYLKGDLFDTHMHYPFASALADWLGVQPGMTSAQLIGRLERASRASAQTNLIHQNLLDSHDTDRFVSMLLNRNRKYDQGNRPQDHDYPYNDTLPPESIYKLAGLAVAIQATYIGAPMIYYGDELGMWGADDPSDRKPTPWPDLGSMQNLDENARPDVLARYVHWFNLRHDDTLGPILRYGSVRHLDSQNPSVFAFERELNGRRVIVAINRQDQPFNAASLIDSTALDSQIGSTVVEPLSASYWLLER